jgi:molybdate transport system substrate-binding protein
MAVFKAVRHLLIASGAVMSFLWLSACAPGAQRTDTVTVFAATSLVDLMEEMAAEYEEATGTTVQLNLASSGVLARQIISGAPADAFISANREWMDEVEKEGKTAAGSRREFARNLLVVVVPADSDIALDTLSDIALLEGRIAIGDPEHVPAGIYARQALEACGAWEIVSTNVVRALDVRAALAYVARGEVTAGIVYATDAITIDGVKTVLQIEPGLYEPIVYYAAVIAGGSERAGGEFLTFATKPQRAALLKKFGFEPPEN